MKVVLQRVLSASVEVNGKIIAVIKQGLLVLVGIEDADKMEDITWLSNKIINLRIFDDQNKIPNLSVKDIAGEIILVSQFSCQRVEIVLRDPTHNGHTNCVTKSEERLIRRDRDLIFVSTHEASTFSRC